jgi:phage shock protein C
MPRNSTKSEKELSLSSEDKKVAGIAGGIAEYYNLSPVWVRIVGIVFIVLSGIIPGLLIYFIIATAIRRGESNN